MISYTWFAVRTRSRLPTIIIIVVYSSKPFLCFAESLNTVYVKTISFTVGIVIVLGTWDSFNHIEYIFISGV